MTNNKTVAAPSTITPVFVPKPVRSLVPPPSAFGIEIGALYEADDLAIEARVASGGPSEIFGSWSKPAEEVFGQIDALGGIQAEAIRLLLIDDDATFETKMEVFLDGIEKDAETLTYHGVITDGTSTLTVKFSHTGKPGTSEVWLAADSESILKVFPKGCGLWVSEIRTGDTVVFSEADYEA